MIAKVSTQSAEKSQSKLMDHSMIIEKIGLKDYIKNLNPEFINNRMCYGYLGKRS
jgi:hypothetical protein